MKVVGLQTQIWDNNIKSVLLLILFPILIAILICMLAFIFVAGSNTKDVMGDTVTWSIIGILFSVPLILIWFLIAYAFNKGIINLMTGAKGVTRTENPTIYNIVENLCISRGLPVPSIQIIEDNSMNAFASGLTPQSASITFTRGLLNRLTPEEIEAVTGHELTHIMNQDIKLMVVSIIFVGIIQTIADFILRVRVGRSSNDRNSGDLGLVILLVKVVAFIIGFFFSIAIQFAISRKREFLADAGSVELTKTSANLISALKKIDSDPFVEAVQNRNIAQMFIDNPLGGVDENGERKIGFFDKLFMTHPPMDERIKALEMIG
ncbi:MAG: M48 family metallopeptidase [bacterium]